MPTYDSTAVLRPNTLNNSADYDRQMWFTTVPNNVPLANILKPGFWINHARKFKPLAKIEVVSEDGTLDVELRVTAIKDGLVFVNPLRVTENAEARAHLTRRAEAVENANETAADLPEELKATYKVGFAPKSGFYVQHRITTEFLFKNIPMKADAVAKAIEHAKAAGVLAIEPA